MVHGARGEMIDGLRTLWHSGSLSGLTDAQLLEKTIGRCDDAAEAAFAAIVERHGGTVRRVCRDVLGDVHEVEDASQAAFLVLARGAKSIRKPDSLGPWLHGVALRVARKAKVLAIRRREAERAASMTDHVRASEPPCPELHEEIDRLPASYREPIVLCYLQGRSQSQAAEALGWPLGTVQTRLHRGKQRLRARLARRGLAPVVAFTAVAVSPAWAEATAREALRFAARRGPTTLVRKLAESALASMSWGLMKAPATIACVTLVAATGIYAAMVARPRPPRPQAVAAVNPPAQAPLAATAKGRAEVHGVVKDEAGRPVAGATVRVVGSPRTDATAETDREGKYVLALPPQVAPDAFLQVSLNASTDDGPRQGINPILVGPLAAPRDITLKPARKMTIRVEDAAGRPVPDADVEVLDDLDSIATRSTGPDGSAVVFVAADAKINWVLAKKAGIGFDYFENYRSWPPADDDPLTAPGRVKLVLDGARSAFVKVVGGDGLPIAGVDVCTWYVNKPGKLANANIAGAWMARSTTGPDGLAPFDWIPARCKGAVPFLLRSSGFHADQQPALPETATDRAQVVMDVVQDATISGQVLDPEGKPARLITVQAEGHGDGPNDARGYGFTGDDGRYSVKVPPNNHYILSVISPAWAAASRTGLHLEQGKPIRGVDFRLTRGTIIRGRVTSNDGKPMKGEQVTFVEQGAKIPVEPGKLVFHHGVEMFSRGATTGEDGRYEHRVGPGRFLIQPPRDNILDPKFIVAVADQREIVRDYVVKPAYTKIPLQGSVKRPDGKPAPGVEVFGEAVLVGQAPGASRFSAKTDAQGTFRVDRYREPLVVYARTVDGSLAVATQLTPDDPTAEVTLAKSATARGRVVDDRGKPLVGVDVQYAFGLEGPDDGINQGGIHGKLPTDGQGRYQLDALPAGAVCVFTVYGKNRLVGLRRVRIDKAGDVAVQDLIVKREDLKELE